MPPHGQPTVVGIPIGRARDAQGWYEQLKAWWRVHKVMRHEAEFAAIAARWDATREAVTPFRADAAPEMAAATGARSVAMLLYSLAL